MSDGPAAAIVDAALHAVVAQRCQRSYVHELRNGLQGIYASVDVLKRFAEGKASANLQFDKVKELARKALQAHDAELSRTVERMTLPKVEPASIDVSALTREICAFLANDAAMRKVTLSSNATDSVVAHASPNRLRSALLGVVVAAIDSLRGPGEIKFDTSSANTRASIKLTLFSQSDALRSDRFWIIEGAQEMGEDWLWRAMQDFVQRDGGALKSTLFESNAVESGRADLLVRRSVELSYRAASPTCAA